LKNVEVLHRVREERNILHTVKRRDVVKFKLEQATKVQRRSRCIAVLFL
jgi:hypothetical protein